MTAERGYSSPDAFRRALTDRLRAAARESRWDLPQLQRQMAYDRLLERLYFIDDGWIVKGAAALLAREIGVRASIDIDVYRAKALEIAEAELRAAATRDIGDWFRFEIGPRQPAGDGSPAIRLPVLAYIGQTEWASFHVDLVGSDIVMTGTPDDVPPLGTGCYSRCRAAWLPRVPARRPHRGQDRLDVPALRPWPTAVDSVPRSGRPRLDHWWSDR